jgi:hypothetical protein
MDGAAWRRIGHATSNDLLPKCEPALLRRFKIGLQ